MFKLSKVFSIVMIALMSIFALTSCGKQALPIVEDTVAKVVINTPEGQQFILDSVLDGESAMSLEKDPTDTHDILIDFELFVTSNNGPVAGAYVTLIGENQPYKAWTNNLGLGEWENVTTGEYNLYVEQNDVQLAIESLNRIGGEIAIKVK